jgi:hypothetical protein
MLTINHIELMQKNVSVLRVVLLSSLMLCVAEAFSTFATPAVFAASQPGMASRVDIDFVRILAKSPLSAKKNAEGIYSTNPIDLVIEVKGQKYREISQDAPGGTGKWRPVSELTYIRKGVFRLDENYWCLSTMPNNNGGSCTARGR